MRRSRDADPFVCNNIDIFIGRMSKTMTRIDAQIHFMMSIGNVEGLGQFPRAGAKPAFIVNAAPFSHQLNPTHGLHRANQNEAVAHAFHQHVQHPVRAVTQVNISRAGFVSFDKCACGRTRKGVAGFVVFGQIGFSFDNFSSTFPPDQLCADKLTRASNRVPSEKRRPNDSTSHTWEMGRDGESIEGKNG